MEWQGRLKEDGWSFFFDHFFMYSRLCVKIKETHEINQSIYQ